MNSWLSKIVLFLLGFLMAQPAALAYKETTHEIFSEYAADNSVLSSSPTLLSDFGLSPYGTREFTNSDGNPNTIQEIVVFGSDFEDDGSISSPFSARVLRHFFDPQGNKGLTFLGVTYPKSPDWALERDQAQGPLSFTSPNQDYSYKEAREYFDAAFACQTASCRLANFSKTFQSMGHIIHHLQDMGQPQHTRLDKHPSSPENFYERYTEIRNTEGIALINANPYVPPTTGPHYFNLPRSYWQTEDPNDNSGMAEFSSTQFVTIGTLFVQDSGSTSGFSGSPGFALPNGSGLVVKTRNVTLTGIGGETKTGDFDFLEDTVSDPLNGVSTPSVKLAARSILDEHLNSDDPEGTPFGTAITVNSAVFDDRYPLLLPRIAAFSTDFINYFFRGRVDMIKEAGSGNNWRIQNKSSESMIGSFALYSEDGNKNRDLVTSWNLTIPGGGSSAPQTFQAPAGAVKYALVFRGQLGAELDAVAGKVLNLNTCTENCADCGVPITPQGGQNNQVQTFTYNVGSQFPQDLSLFFEAYSIPDQLQVKSGNTVLYDTGGLVSGLNTATIDYDPSAHGSSLDVLINAPNAGTAWNFCLDCNSSSEVCGQYNDAYNDLVTLQGAISGSGSFCTATAIFTGRTISNQPINSIQDGNTINIFLLPDTYDMALTYSNCESGHTVGLSVSLAGQELVSRGWPNLTSATFTVPGRPSTTNDGS